MEAPEQTREERAVRMLATLYQRRDDLKRINTPERYRQAMDLAVGTLRANCAAKGMDGFASGLALAKEADGEGENYAAMFYLVAILEDAERKDAGT